MSDAAAADQNLAAAAWPAEGMAPLLRGLILVLAGTVFIAICAHIKVPMWPVPMTMQTFAVLVIGMAYGWRLGGLTVLAYLGEGAAGLPVFATGSGLAYLAGPTAGYLAGFLLAALFVGWAAERGWDRSLAHVAATMAAGTAIIFACGVPWLAGFLGAWDKALAGGLYPFLLGDAIKVALAAMLLPAAWRLVDRRRGSGSA